MTERIIYKLDEIETELSLIGGCIGDLNDALESVGQNVKDKLNKTSVRVVDEIEAYANLHDINKGEVNVIISYTRPNMSTLEKIKCLGDEVDSIGQYIGIWRNDLREKSVTPVHIINSNFVWKIELIAD